MLLGLLVTFPVSSEAVSYTFTKIADTQGNFTTLNQPSINADGTVAFNAGTQGVFTGNGESLTTIADTSDSLSAFGGGLSINNNGVVAFKANLPLGDERIFTGNGGALTTIADASDGLSGFNPASINSSGKVAFFAGVLGQNDQGIFTAGNGGPITTIANTSTFPGGFEKNPSINSSGTVAFTAFRGASDQGVFTGSGDSLTTIADSSGPLAVFPLGPGINDDGTVAFSATLDGGGVGVFTGNGGSLTTIADTSDGFIAFATQGVSINNQGDVAFFGFTASQFGIFTGPNLVADKVIASGDLLFGSPVTGGFAFSTQGLNDSGQIAFLAETANGISAIYRADPVPEPSTILLLGFGLAGLGIFRKTRKMVC